MTLPDGSTWIDISLEQTARRMPIDETLMQGIDEDLYYLKLGAAGISTWNLDFKLNGNLASIVNPLPIRRIDTALISNARTLSSWGVYLESPGTSGTLEIDVRKYRSTQVGIQSIAHQYSGNVQSVSNASPTQATQSISKAVTQVATQSITFWKAAINISSIIGIGSNLWRYNLASANDADWAVGDSVLFASCSSGANNGTFTIVRLNDDGGNNIIVTNVSGVAQTGAAGTAQLQAMSYNLTNPADSVGFVPGETGIFAAHSTGANNGNLLIYKINQGGNNIIVKNATGVTQGGVAGTIDAAHWKYVFVGAASADFVVAESIIATGHSTGANNGTFRILAVNSGGNNLIVYNTAGVAQGGIAGNVASDRWIYALDTDPASSFNVADTFVAAGCTAAANNGTFTVVQVDRSATNNLVVANTAGVTQAGVLGTIVHTRKLVKFSVDQSALFATSSRVGISNVGADTNYNLDGPTLAEFTVLQINRGGGSNFNIVIDCPAGTAVPSPCGRVEYESRSVFSTRPTITVLNHMQVATNGVLDTTEKTVASGRILAMELLQIPAGAPSNLVVQVA